MRRHLAWILGLLLVIFGMFCLNYTQAGGLEHHRQVAERLGLPQPAEWILGLGVVSIIMGSGMIGFRIGRRRSRAEP